MKNLLKIITFSFAPFLFVQNGHAQDTLVMRNGNNVLAKVLEVSATEVKYKRFDVQDGPDYIEQKTNVAAIHYANGLKESFPIQPVMPTPSAVTNNWKLADTKIERRGPMLFYQGKRFSERGLHSFLLASQNKDVIKLELKSRKAKNLSAIGIVAIPLAIAAIGAYVLGAAFQSDAYTPFAKGCAIVAIPVGLTGIIFSSNSNAYRRDAIDAYNATH